jgi:hypothetical protein
VKRLLADPRARPTVRTFVKEWFGLSVISTVPKDSTTFPDLTDAVRAALEREVDRFVDHVVFEHDGSLEALLTSTQTHFDPALADYYGLAASGGMSDGAPIDLSDQERMGILTLGGTMLAHARSNDASPVQRGKLVRQDALCEVLPPMPAGIAIEAPGLDPTKTTRERYKEHSENPSCAGCHRLMDPIGFAFDHYDGIGRYRKDENGQAIDESAQVLVQSDVKGDYPSLKALITKLAKSDDVRACYARSLFRFSYGITEDTRGSCLGERLQQKFAESDGSFSALVDVLTSSFLLTEREPEPAAQADLDAGATGDEPSSRGDAGAPASAEGGTASAYTLELTIDNDWGAGYCHTYELTNTSQAPLTWSVSLDLGGTLNQNWESDVKGSTGTVTFTGASYNAVLQAGASTEFGFCVTR